MITAIVVLVVLAGLGTAIASLTQIANLNQSLDLLGSRALMAARAGVEWQSWLILNPEDTNPTVAPFTTPYACPATQSQTFSGLDEFTVSVNCMMGNPTEDLNAIRIYSIQSVACNKPSGGVCPNTNAPTGTYVERSVTVLIETCRQPSGATCL
jgi:MSHA biogenesis protein MshP